MRKDKILVDTGISIEKLRKKYGVGINNPDESVFTPVNESIKTVQVEMPDGTTKTADIKDGNITIIQG